MTREYKAFVAKELTEAGEIEAVVSTFGIVDRDRDVVLPSAFIDGQAIPLVWAHDWTRPIGKGVIRVEAAGAVFEGRFNLATSWGRDAYEAVKFAEALQEYSWGFRVIESDIEERDGERVRVIKRTEVFEVSPVLVGAGLGTRTVAVKDREQAIKQAIASQSTPTSDDATMPDVDQRGVFNHLARHLRDGERSVPDLKDGEDPSEELLKLLPLDDHLTLMLTVSQVGAQRARLLTDRRLKEGRAISAERRQRMGAIAGAMRAAADELEAILRETAPEKSPDGRRLFAEYQRTLARLNGVAV